MARITEAVSRAATLAGLLGLATLACGQGGAANGREVAAFIEDLQVGEPVAYENLTVFPVYYGERGFHVSLVTLDEAFEKKWLKITEVEGGQVPQVEVSNLSDKSIFMMGGEILTGCRQDRIVGRDVVLGPWHKKVIVPVYCVERGRWTYESDQFYSKKNLGTTELRAEAQKASDLAQSRIWSEVSDLHVRGGSAGETRFQEVFEAEGAKRQIAVIEEKLADVPRLFPDADGAVFCVGDQILSIDVFRYESVFKALWPKILRSAALATFACDAHCSVTQNDVVRFLRSLHDKRYTERRAVDLGSELTLADEEVNVNALVYPDKVFHLAAFPEGPAKPAEKSGDDERRIRVWMRQ